MGISGVPAGSIDGFYDTSIPPEYLAALALQQAGYDITFDQLYSSGGSGKSNIVRNPPNVRGLEYGSLTINESFQGMPTASISYEGVPGNEIRTYLGYYEPGDRVSIDGERYIVTSHGYTRSKHGSRHLTEFETFTVSANLEWEKKELVDRKIYIGDLLEQQVSTGDGSREVEITARQIASKAGVSYSGPDIKIKTSSEFVSLAEIVNQNAIREGCFVYYHGSGIELKKLGYNTKTYSDDRIIQDGENSIGLPTTLKDVRVTLPPLEQEEADPTDDQEQPATEFERETIQTETLREGDPTPEVPPSGSIVLRTLDSCHDQSGPTKTDIITKVVSGTTISQTTKIWGFEYTAEDIHVGDGLLLGDPADFWRVIETKTTVHEYTKINGMTAEISVSDKNNPSQKIPIFVHPDYENILKQQLGLGNETNTSSVNLEAYYLVGIKTTGWKSVRLKAETDALETLFPDDPYYGTYQFRRTPLIEETGYRIRSARGLYPGSEQNNGPFSVSVESTANIDPRIKEKLRQLYISPDSTNPDANLPPNVAIVTADPNYQEPMLVLEETQYSDSFTAQADPESTPENPLKPLVTGNESYANKKNRIMSGTEKYRQTETQWSFQEAGFNRGAEQVYTREALGRPGSASTLQRATWEQKQAANSPFGKTQRIGADQLGLAKPDRLFILNSSGSSDKYAPQITGTGSVPEGVETAAEISNYFETELRLQNLNVASASKTIAWDERSVHVGMAASFGGDLFRSEGSWIVTGVSRNYEFLGRIAPLGGIICKTDGTKLSLGMDFRQSVSVREEVAGQDSPQDPNAPLANDFDVKVKLTGGDFTRLRTVAPPQSRRNFAV